MFIDKSKMAASKMAGWGLNGYISVTTQLRKVWFRFYGSINVMDSVKLPSVIFLQLQDGDIQDGYIQIGVLMLSCT